MTMYMISISLKDAAQPIELSYDDHDGASADFTTILHCWRQRDALPVIEDRFGVTIELDVAAIIAVRLIDMVKFNEAQMRLQYQRMSQAQKLQARAQMPGSNLLVPGVMGTALGNG
jgi:hypothetical protein